MQVLRDDLDQRAVAPDAELRHRLAPVPEGLRGAVLEVAAATELHPYQARRQDGEASAFRDNNCCQVGIRSEAHPEVWRNHTNSQQGCES